MVSRMRPMNLNNWGKLGACQGRGSMDLNTYRLTVPGSTRENPDSEIEYHMLHAHESSHWVRFHGSTIGVSLSLMKYASERLVADYILNLEQAEKNALIEARKSGHPIFD